MPIYQPGGPTAPPKKNPNQPYTPPGHQDRPYEPGQPTTGRGAPGSPDPGPPPPPPPVEAPPAPPPPPPPPKMDWNAYLAADPGYAAVLASLQGQEGNLLT